MCGSLATKNELRIQTCRLVSTTVCSNLKLDKQLWDKSTRKNSKAHFLNARHRQHKSFISLFHLNL
ncbi:hypothetical protein CNEO3_140055 [Clostridium neonatale]|nr:hypothetical protein CNEO_1300040 [Clostridium neonatale]CAI3583862.1 hypothetical protein CNEO3_140055 [Clostridium neonatale]CAI3592373.1 hypothetical protein CNEO3_210042 [Clostridium neonatale]CAI3661297.1 hypothetical protein CNEO3_430018 [Clostridium neonatale]